MVGSVLGFLDPAWPMVKPKTSSKVVGRDVEPRGGGAVWSYWTCLKGFSKQWVVSSLRSLRLTILASGKAAGSVGPSVESLGGSAVSGCWAGNG